MYGMEERVRDYNNEQSYNDQCPDSGTAGINEHKRDRNANKGEADAIQQNTF